VHRALGIAWALKQSTGENGAGAVASAAVLRIAASTLGQFAVSGTYVAWAEADWSAVIMRRLTRKNQDTDWKLPKTIHTG